MEREVSGAWQHFFVRQLASSFRTDESWRSTVITARGPISTHSRLPIREYFRTTRLLLWLYWFSAYSGSRQGNLFAVYFQFSPFLFRQSILLNVYCPREWIRSLLTMLAGSKILPINVEVDTSHVTVGDSDVLSASLQICNTLVHGDHHPRTRNPQFRNPKKIPSRSPDLIVLSDAGQSPVYVICFSLFFFSLLQYLIHSLIADLLCL